MGVVHHLQQYNLPLDVEAFIAAHKDCPDEPAVLKELWQMVRPSIFWREEAISGNDGESLVLGKGEVSIEG